MLHLALKSGLLGLALFLGLAVSPSPLFTRRALRRCRRNWLGIGTAGLAGIAFMLPDFLVGTPVPQVRTTQMLAFCMALPYVAMAAADAASAVRAPRRRACTAPGCARHDRWSLPKGR